MNEFRWHQKRDKHRLAGRVMDYGHALDLGFEFDGGDSVSIRINSDDDHLEVARKLMEFADWIHGSAPRAPSPAPVVGG